MSIHDDKLNSGDPSETGCLVMLVGLAVMAMLPVIVALVALTVWMW